MARAVRVLLRGFRFRCPACGLGRFHARRGHFEEGCLECSHVYLRDPGDWTGAAETSILLTILAGFTAFYATGRAGWDLGVRLGAAVAVAVAALLVIYPRVKGLWIGLIYLWDGPVPPPPPRTLPERPPAERDDSPSEWERPKPVVTGGEKRRLRR